LACPLDRTGVILGFRNVFAIRPELAEQSDTESQQGIAATVENTLLKWPTI
jgi:hypothetical protein